MQQTIRPSTAPLLVRLTNTVNFLCCLRTPSTAETTVTGSWCVIQHLFKKSHFSVLHSSFTVHGIPFLWMGLLWPSTQFQMTVLPGNSFQWAFYVNSQRASTIGLVLGTYRTKYIRSWMTLLWFFFYVEEFPPNATILTWLDREEQLTTCQFFQLLIETTLRFLFSNKKVCVQSSTEFKNR